MKFIVLVPKVVQNFINQFPEVRHNAYKYFNYDNRIVEERVDRHDTPFVYKGADDFTDADYQSLITYAKTLINPILAKYSIHVAHEDALHMAIRSFNGGLFDGKVNAGRYAVLLKAMIVPDMVIAPVMAKKKKEEEKPKTVTIKPHVLKQLGLTRKDIPMKQRVEKRVRDGVPLIVREKGKHVIKKVSE